MAVVLGATLWITTSIFKAIGNEIDPNCQDGWGACSEMQLSGRAQSAARLPEAYTTSCV